MGMNPKGNVFPHSWIFRKGRKNRMKKFAVSALLAGAVVLTTGVASAQLTTNWQIDAGDQAWFANDNNTRGMGYNPVNDTVLVVSRTGGLSVQSLNAQTGAVGTPLDVTGISGGTFTLNDVAVTDDGVIYGTNLVLSGNLLVYRWANEAATPALVATIAVATRYGDTMAVRGVDSDNSTEIFVGGNGSGDLLRLVTADNGATFAVAGTNGTIATGQTTSWGGILPRTDNTNVIIASLGETVKELQLDGTLVDTGDSGVIGSSFGYGSLYYNDNGDIYMGLQVGNATPVVGRVFDITSGLGVGQVSTFENTPSMGANSNGNGAGGVEWTNDDQMIVLSTNNAIGSYGDSSVFGTTDVNEWQLLD